MEVPGWIASDVACRLRDAAGGYRWDEWERFADERGFRIEIRDLPAWLPAFHVGSRVFLGRHLSLAEKARWAWHEIGHAMLHGGSFKYWDALPWGYLVLGKWERQASEFAALFPVWGEE